MNLISLTAALNDLSQKRHGNSPRTEAILADISAEMSAIMAEVTDPEPYARIILLALDGALRCGYSAMAVAMTVDTQLKRMTGKPLPPAMGVGR